jgi:glycosyltransferase involved in cell wall biosynthesis
VSTTLTRSRGEERTSLPEVDVVIPTLNCERQLEECLRSLRRQRYEGKVNIIQIDGGSSDGTVSVGSQFGCEVIIAPGIYPGGLKGSRNLAVSMQRSPLTWVVDSDNVILGEEALSRLVAPFQSLENLQISVPLCRTTSNMPPLSRYLTYREEMKLERAGRIGYKTGGWIVSEDFSHGVTNCSLIRTDLIREVGGFDSDIRVWARARAIGKSKGCIVPEAAYAHFSGECLSSWARKKVGRCRRISRIQGAELREYLHPSSRSKSTFLNVVTDILLQPFSWFSLSTVDARAAIFGLAIPVLWLGMVVRYPVTSLRLVKGFFGDSH